MPKIANPYTPYAKAVLRHFIAEGYDYIDLANQTGDAIDLLMDFTMQVLDQHDVDDIAAEAEMTVNDVLQYMGGDEPVVHAIFAAVLDKVMQEATEIASHYTAGNPLR